MLRKKGKYKKLEKYLKKLNNKKIRKIKMIYMKF